MSDSQTLASMSNQNKHSGIVVPDGVVTKADSDSVHPAATDVFWPDNPNRKARVQQLSDDIRWIQTQLQIIQSAMTQKSTSLQPQINACMKAMGLATFDDLEAHIEKVCSSGDVERWKETKARMDLNDTIETTIFGVVDLTAAGIGVVGAVLLFVVPPLGEALLLTSGAISVAEEFVQALVDIVEGEEIRDQCRAAMAKLYPDRIQAELPYQQMLIMQGWLGEISNIMTAFEQGGMSESDAAKAVSNMHILSEGLVTKYQEMGYAQVMPILAQLDASRNSWTQEDPRF